MAKAWRKVPGILLNAVLDWFYPPHCYHCGTFLEQPGNRLLCPTCTEWLFSSRITPPCCAVCGLSLPGSDGHNTCLSCRSLRPRFDRAWAVFPYSGPAASIVRSYKYQGNAFLGPELLRWIIDRGWLPDEGGTFDSVVPVPLHRRRRAERGYNQAALLARIIAEWASAPMMENALVRKRHTKQQARLSRPKRKDNVRGAFATGPRQTVGHHVLLVDDVMTTGATSEECARALKKGGAAEVSVLTLVRAGK